VERLLGELVEGRAAALAKLISLVERDAEAARTVSRFCHPRTGRAYRLGITGPPGCGKSTIINALAGRLRARGDRLGVVAVDPTSSLHGGALLGDRVRMGSLGSDPGVFIRSLGSRGDPGGLSTAADDASDLLDAFGMDWVILETVGVGQAELAVASRVHTTIVALVPESGDSIQAMKAGLMEIGDVYVVNKADRPGAASAAEALKEALREGSVPGRDWSPPVVSTRAREDEGIEELLEQVDAHARHLREGKGLEARREWILERRVRRLVELEVASELWSSDMERRLRSLLESTRRGELSPREAAGVLVTEYRAPLGGEA
jgi:LAO/AO transport system kinase